MKFLGTLNVADANTAAANFRAMMVTWVSFMPTGSTITIDSTAAQYDDGGSQTGEITITVIPATITGTSNVAYAGGSGAVINWTTGAFHLGRKVRGRTFAVPLTSAAFFTDGTLTSAAQGTIQSGAQTFAVSSPTPVVFSQKPASGGGVSSLTSVVTGATVPDRSAILRSRRD
jgi:hypothetical protein